MRNKTLSKSTTQHGEPRPEPPPDLELRAIPGMEDYAASRDGRIWAVWHETPRLMVTRNHRTSDGRTLPRVRLSVKGRLRDCYVARLVADAWLADTRPEGATVSFLDGDPGNTTAENLSWREGRVFVPDSAFVAEWQASGSIAEAAERMGLVPSGISLRARKLRARGIPLKMLGTRDMDLSELKTLAEESLEETRED